MATQDLLMAGTILLGLVAADLSRGGESRICKQQGPISFNEYGDLEYCS